ncbi:hypothetical protein BKA81DRAFT_348971 [Phyllosticta paracitricarpa]
MDRSTSVCSKQQVTAAGAWFPDVICLITGQAAESRISWTTPLNNDYRHARIHPINTSGPLRQTRRSRLPIVPLPNTAHLHTRLSIYLCRNKKQTTLPTYNTVPVPEIATATTTTTTTIMPINNNESGVSSGVKFVTSTVGNTVGGLLNTVGGVVGAAGRGVGETLEGATGSAGRPVARGVADAASGVEDGTGRIARGVKDAGQGK